MRHISRIPRRPSGSINAWALCSKNADAQLFCATVGEEVAFGPAQMGLPADELERRVRDAMELFQVADLADVSPYQLSGGQKKRVALAAVVSMNPDILVTRRAYQRT